MQLIKHSSIGRVFFIQVNENDFNKVDEKYFLKVNIMTDYPSEPLNVLHAIDFKRMYPVVSCQVQLTDRIDLNRLKQAVLLTAQVEPLLFSRYHRSQNEWISLPLNADQVVIEVADTTNLFDPKMKIDWENDVQLKIFVSHSADGDHLGIYISHIMTDGGGFKQYLRLLSTTYTELTVDAKLHNNPSIVNLTKAIMNSKPSGNHSDHPQNVLGLPIDDQPGKRSFVGHVETTPTESKRIISWSKQQGVTINDLLMGAFIYRLRQYNDFDDIALACPTDMRNFMPQQDEKTLRIGNLTSRYNPSFKVLKSDDLMTVIQTVHQEMSDLKAQRQCFDSIRDLLTNVDNKSLPELWEIVETNYHVRPIGYTNMGMVNDDCLQFGNLTTKSAFINGSFRTAPMFQMAASTFHQQISLTFNMIGSQTAYKQGMEFLQEVKQAILSLIK